MKKLILEVSMWCEADPEQTYFMYAGLADLPQEKLRIDGTQYMELSDEEKKDYILGSVLEAFGESYEYDFTDINILVE